MPSTLRVIHSRFITSRYPIVMRFEFLSNFVLYTSDSRLAILLVLKYIFAKNCNKSGVLNRLFINVRERILEIKVIELVLYLFRISCSYLSMLPKLF